MRPLRGWNLSDRIRSESAMAVVIVFNDQQDLVIASLECTPLHDRISNTFSSSFLVLLAREAILRQGSDANDPKTETETLTDTESTSETVYWDRMSG